MGKVGIDQTTDGTTNAVHLTAGSNIAGKVGIDQTTPGTTNKVSIGTDGTVALNAPVPAGTNLMGKVGIDQTTDGTTNAVHLTAGSNIVGSVLGRTSNPVATPTVTASFAYTAGNCVGVSMKFKIRIGRSNNLTKFSSTSNAAVTKITTAKAKKGDPTWLAKITKAVTAGVRKQVTQAGMEIEQARIRAVIMAINEDMRQDLRVFAEQVIEFFFSKTSSETGAPLTISLAPLKLLDVSSGFRVGTAADGSDKIVWTALTPATVRRKGNTIYFFNTGQLQLELTSLLPAFFLKVLNPVLKVEFVDPETVGVTPLEPIAALEVLVATGNFAGNTPANVSFLRGEVFSAGPVNVTLLRNYVRSGVEAFGSEIENKLMNRGRGNERTQRPFIEPATAYWVLNRLPYVLLKSVRKHL